MLTGKEIELGFLRKGLKTHAAMGNACGLNRLQIFRIIMRGQKPTIEQYEKILKVIEPLEQQKETYHSKDPALNPLSDLPQRIRLIEERILMLEKKSKP
jgi:hypothetical protein